MSRKQKCGLLFLLRIYRKRRQKMQVHKYTVYRIPEKVF